jgi:mannose/cellobiose epimerase-like protein (N-acyl-D-glucosamine 2-epimerase family)
MAVALPTAAAASATPAEAAASPPPSAEALALRRSLAEHLRGPHFDFWLDPKHYDTDRLVIQARRLYYLSTMAMGDANNANPLSCEAPPLSDAQRKAAATAADAAFLEMKEKFRQPNGGWRFWLDTDPIEKPQQVAMYGQVFALYALSTYARAALKHSAEARLLAHQTFDEIAARTSPEGAVARETYAPDFVSPLPGGFDQNAVGAFGVKALGTHLHLTEALIAYRRLFQRDKGMKDSDKFGWTAARSQASKQALERAAQLLLAMRQGYLVLEQRDQQDARRPAPLAAADGSRGQSYLPGHGVQAAFQLWDAAEVLGAESDTAALPKAAVLEFSTAVLDGARELEVVSKQQQASSVGPSASSPYRWLPQAYKPTRAWQLVREAEQRQADAAARVAAALSPSPSSSSSPSSPSSIPRKRILPLMGGLVTVETTTSSPSPLPPVVVAPARLPPPPRSALTLAHPDVNWWTQMEHLLALLRTAKELRSSSAGADPTLQAKADAYVARAADAWRLLSEKFADPKTGAFHWGVDRETLKPNGPVSDGWKASYHSSRAMVNGLRALC